MSRDVAGTQRLAAGAKLGWKDTLAVWPGSSAVLQFPDGTRMELHEKTVIGLKIFKDLRQRQRAEVLLNRGPATTTRDPAWRRFSSRLPAGKLA
jgi:hypothetical protein